MYHFVHKYATRALAVASTLLACVMLVSCSKAAKQTLRLNLVPGSTYALSIRTSVDGVVTTADGKSMPFPTTSLSTFTLHAGEVDEQGNTYLSAEVGDSKFPMVFVPLAEFVKGYTFGVKMSPVGRVTEFVNTDAMRAGVRKSLEALGTGSTVYGDTPPDLAIANISDEALRAVIEPITSVWPGMPVGPGDEWTGPEIYTPLSHTITTAQYRLVSADDSEVVVHAELHIRPAGDHERDPRLPAVGATSGKGSGEIRLDPMTGTIRSYEVTEETSGTVQIGGADATVTANRRIQGELMPR